MIKQRRQERQQRTRREQLLASARECARFNSELHEQRQRRGPLHYDVYTNTVQLLPSHLVRTSSTVTDERAKLERQLRQHQVTNFYLC